MRKTRSRLGKGVFAMPLDELIRRRIMERKGIIEELRNYAERLKSRFGKLTMILYGSYARGDFNLWSDVDVVIVSEYFRNRNFITRCIELNDAPPRLEPVCWTPDEALKALTKPWWREALKDSIIITDDYELGKILRR